MCDLRQMAFWSLRLSHLSCMLAHRTHKIHALLLQCSWPAELAHLVIGYLPPLVLESVLRDCDGPIGHAKASELAGGKFLLDVHLEKLHELAMFVTVRGPFSTGRFGLDSGLPRGARYTIVLEPPNPDDLEHLVAEQFTVTIEERSNAILGAGILRHAVETPESRKTHLETQVSGQRGAVIADTAWFRLWVAHAKSWQS